MRVLSWDVGIKNLAYCILDTDDKYKQDEEKEKEEHCANILFWDVITLQNESKHLHKLSEELFEKLNSMGELYDNIDVVVIENQPCMRNPKMKTMQIMLYSFFVMKCNTLMKGDITDDFKKTKVCMMSANNKLKCYKGETIELKTKSKSKYIIRKKMAIEHCKFFIKSNEINYDYFMSSSKKDDLADSYLQGLYYIKKNDNFFCL